MEQNKVIRGRVSVITPFFNDGDYILDCVSSVQGSTYDDIEHIIIDDGSEANHSKVLDNINYPNVIIIHKSNQGVCIARNAALEIATGEYILPLDADDRISSNYISDAVDLLKNDLSLRIVTSEITQRFGESNIKTSVCMPFDMGVLLSRNLFNVTTMFRSCDAKKVGGFDIDFKKGLEDWNFWISIMSLGGSVGVVSGVNFYYRIKPNHRNASFGGEIGHRHLQKKIWEKHKELYMEYYADPYETYAYRALKQEVEHSTKRRLKNIVQRFIDRYFMESH